MKKKQILFSVVVLMLLQFIIFAEMSVVMPLAAVIADFYRVPVNQVTLLNVGYALFGLLAPLMGISSEKYGLKNTLLAGSFFFILGCFIVSTGKSPLLFAIGRAFIGLSYYTLISLTVAYANRLTNNRHVGTFGGYFKIAFAIAVFSSPLMGSAIVSAFDIPTLYRSLGTAMVIVSILMLFLPSIPLQHAQNHQRISIVEIIKVPGAKRMIISTMLMSLPSVFYFNYLSVHLAGIGVPTGSIAMVYSIGALGTLLAGFFILFFNERFGKGNILLVGIIISTLMIVLIPYQHNLLLFAIVFIFSFAFDLVWGLLYPLGSILVAEHSAVFLTVLSLTMSLTNVVTNLIAPWVFPFGGFPLTTLICGVGLVLSLFLLIKPLRPIR